MVNHDWSTIHALAGDNNSTWGTSSPPHCQAGDVVVNHNNQNSNNFLFD